jgi:hypothetical protein
LSSKSSGFGTTQSTKIDCSGFVHQVITGSFFSKSIVTILSYSAFSSDDISFHCFIKNSKFSDTYSLHFKYSKVFSSGLINPDFAPHSIAILQTVILHSIDISSIYFQQNSIA